MMIWGHLSDTHLLRKGSNSNYATIAVGILRILQTGYSTKVHVDEKGKLTHNTMWNHHEKRVEDVNVVETDDTVKSLPNETQYWVSPDRKSPDRKAFSALEGEKLIKGCLAELVRKQTTIEELKTLAIKISGKEEVL